MIEVEKLNNNMVAISGNLRGVLGFTGCTSTKYLEDIISSDITSYFDSVSKVNLLVELEEYEDWRSLKSLQLMKIELLLIFESSIIDEAVDTILGYLTNMFIIS